LCFGASSSVHCADEEEEEEDWAAKGFGVEKSDDDEEDDADEEENDAGIGSGAGDADDNKEDGCLLVLRVLPLLVGPMLGYSSSSAARKNVSEHTACALLHFLK
jgi:hypothetical protein